MNPNDPLKKSVSRFLDAWLGARQLIQAANFNRFQKAGLSATQFMTLNLIPANKAGMTLTELARRMNLGAATLTKTVDSLESRGLLTRIKSDKDRRQVILSLTDEGETLQNAVSAEFHDQMANLFRKMDADRRNGLVAGLEALLEASVDLPAITITDDGVRQKKRSSPRSQRP